MSEQPQDIGKIILAYKTEAEEAKRERMDQNQENFDCFHLKQNWAHKKKGQSKEFLAKTSIAVEQLTSFLQQGLVDQGKWFSIENEPGVNVQTQKISPDVQMKLLSRQLKKNKFPLFVADSLKLGFLGSLMIAKVTGSKTRTITDISAVRQEEDGKPEKVEITSKKFWNLKLNLIRQEDFFPDPTGSGLYTIERIEVDKHELLELGREFPHIYDLQKIKDIQARNDTDQDLKKKSETGQQTPLSRPRFRVILYEFWGTIVDSNTGEVLHENVTSVITEDGTVISKPRENPNWHGEDPYIVSPIVRVPKSVWHKALMDTGTKLNKAINELFNLQLDAGMMSTYGIKQLRESWLDDPSQIDDGIPAGETLIVNNQCPPGAKVLERVDTGNPAPEAQNIFNIAEREFNSASLTNDIRMGAMPQRQVKATEIVASNQAINTIFNGVVKIIESGYVTPILEKAWLTMAQHMDDISLDEVKGLIGNETARVINEMTKAEVFADTAKGKAFKVFGLSTTLNKINDFRKITSLLQSISASPILMESFQRDYSFTRLLEEIIKSLDIDVDKLKASDMEKQASEQEKQLRLKQMEQPKDQQSQIPQMEGTREEASIEVQRGQLSQGMTTPGE